MARLIKARTTLSIISGGYPGEGVGGTNTDYLNWREIPESGAISSGYYFHDSEVASDSNSSRVIAFVEDSWTYTVDENNYAHVTLTTRITSMRRDQVAVTTPNPLTRNIRVWDRKGGRLLIERIGDPINTEHDIISSPITVEVKNFTVAPGGHTSVDESIYIRTTTQGHDGDPVPSQYVDEAAIGIEFLNDLPIDYRPGMTWYPEWESHNRNGGAADVMDGSWTTMRTNNGGQASDNPPYIYDSGWKNQRKIGNE